MMDETGLLQIIFILSMIKVGKSKILGFIIHDHLLSNQKSTTWLA